MQERGIKALNGRQKQEDLARHFRVPPLRAHDAEMDALTLQYLFPHLLDAANSTLEELLTSASRAVGMLKMLAEPTGARHARSRA